MDLNLHGVTKCTLRQEHFEGGGEPLAPGLPPPPEFHVTHLAIAYEDGSTAKIRLFSPEQLEISNE
jgi:hypothetical protein